MKEFIKTVIASGDYVLEDLERKIKKLYVYGDLTESDADELLALAAENADNSAQIDMYAKLVDLEHRLVALETADYAIWTVGYTTKKGEIVKFDIDEDGEYEFVMYDGGRNETALSVGKINGWYKVTSTGVKTHTITKGADGSFVLTPVE